MRWRALPCAPPAPGAAASARARSCSCPGTAGRAAVELEDPAGDVVEEVAIVGDGHDRALVLGEVALQPADRLGVEVVGRLVEQQQVRLGQQQPRERDPPPLAAGERRDVRVAGRAAQRVHRLVDHRVEAPGVGGVDLLLQPRELVGGLVGVVGRQLVEAVEQVAQLADAVLDVAAHVLGLVELGLLLEQPDAGAGRELGLAAIVSVLPGHDPQQRRLAAAVEAQHADLGAGRKLSEMSLQHFLVRRMDPGQLVHREHVLARHEPTTIVTCGTRQADPCERTDHHLDDRGTRHLGVIGPPQRDPDAGRADQLGEWLDLLVGDAQLRLGTQQRNVGRRAEACNSRSSGCARPAGPAAPSPPPCRPAARRGGGASSAKVLGPLARRA